MSDRSLRVTLIGLHYAPEPSGNAPYTTSLAAELAARGHQVSVVTGYPHYPQWKLFEGYSGAKQCDVADGVSIVRLRQMIPSRPTNFRRALMELSFGVRLLAAHWQKPDVVVFVSPALISSFCGLVRARLGGVPSVLWVQDLYGLGAAETGSTSGFAAKALKLLEKYTMKMAGAIVAIHETFRRHICQDIGIPEEHVDVVRNWTHLPIQTGNRDRELVRKEKGWDEDDVVVLHAGNMGVKQGLGNVVEAARQASHTDSRVRFVLLGDGNQRNRLERLGAGVERLEFLAPVPDVGFQELLAAADILLVNEQEGITGMSVPSKLTSYFATGLPVLAATDADSVTAGEIAASGGGLRVEANNAMELLQAAAALGADPDLRRRLGDSGLAFRRRTLGKSGAVSKFEEVFLTAAAMNPLHKSLSTERVPRPKTDSTKRLV